VAESFAPTPPGTALSDFARRNPSEIPSSPTAPPHRVSRIYRVVISLPRHCAAPLKLRMSNFFFLRGVRRIRRGEGDGHALVLAQRAASEGPRWTRAVRDQPGHPLERQRASLEGALSFAGRSILGCGFNPSRQLHFSMDQIIPGNSLGSRSGRTSFAAKE